MRCLLRNVQGIFGRRVDHGVLLQPVFVDRPCTVAMWTRHPQTDQIKSEQNRTEKYKIRSDQNRSEKYKIRSDQIRTEQKIIRSDWIRPDQNKNRTERSVQSNRTDHDRTEQNTTEQNR